MFVKICGLGTVEDVAVAEEAGADAIGIVQSSTSPRAVDIRRARQLAGAARRAETVLVVHDVTVDEALERAADIGVDVLQMHGYGEEDTRTAATYWPRVWRAGPVGAGPTKIGAWGEEVLLLDSTTPGSGEVWDLETLGNPPIGQWMLAGGLTLENVRPTIETIRPWGVDVSSGVESSRGVKDHEKIRRFVAAARGYGV
ncbi:Phosphoribosylanthranilate isomerase [Actinomycetales bacterium JB111]|nr:Phosphoribosylanthranilate isomerase [Actinomycetales bacterium JB111]